MTDLGGVLTDNLKECTVLITDKVRRTAKFLCMVGKGVPIVGPGWIKASKDAKAFQGERGSMPQKINELLAKAYLSPHRPVAAFG